MSGSRLTLKVAIGFLMLDALLEMALISSMVAWLHRRAGGSFEINYDDASFSLHGKPMGLLVDHGHTSNGAAGTAFVIVGLGGILAMSLRSRSDSRASRVFYHSWLCVTFLSALLSLAAILYTFLLTYQHWNQKIDIALASTLNNKPYPDYVAYPEMDWTPENWLYAVLLLPLQSSTDMSETTAFLQVTRVWRWNLIPLFLLGLVVCVSAVSDAIRSRNGRNTSSGGSMGSKGFSA